MAGGRMGELVGLYVQYQLPTPVPTLAQVCHIFRVLSVSLQGTGPELRGQRGGAAGNKACQAVPQPRTCKLPAASPQPGKFRELGLGFFKPLNLASFKPPVL